MGISEPAELVEFDAAAAVEAGQEVAGDQLLTCVEFTDEDWHSLYISDQVLAMYHDREHMDAHFDELHDYLHIDLGERELLESQLSEVGSVRYFVTRMSHVTMVRLLDQNKNQGLWTTLTNTAAIRESTEAMQAAGFDSDSSDSSPYA
jgi:hypothetical protein